MTTEKEEEAGRAEETIYSSIVRRRVVEAAA